MKAKIPSKHLQVASLMPPLAHWVGDQPFDIMASAVVGWLVAQPDIRQWLFQQAKDRRLIVFDPTTRTWCGVQHTNQ